MANKQKVPAMGLNGVFALKEARSQPLATVKFETPVNPALEMLSNAAKGSVGFLKAKETLDKESMTLEAAGVLKDYRAKLSNSQSEEDFDTIAKAAEDDLNNRFKDRFYGESFWQEKGAKILEANRKDVEQLRKLKSFDFGKQSLNNTLAGNQNLLAYSDGKNGEALLSRGVEEIESTPFLSAEEKQQYRKGYLQTGILNLALNDADRAAAMADKYMPDMSEAIRAKISQTQALKNKAESDRVEKLRRSEAVEKYHRAFSVWQAKEAGQISPAEFYVMTAENESDALWGDSEDRSQTPLADAYKIVKKINRGEQLSAEEIRDAGNSFIAAYRRKEIGLNEVESLQNQLMLSQGDSVVSGLLFDSDVDKLADKVLLPDLSVAGTGGHTADFMEQKAKLAFDIYENYYSKKTALADAFIEQGGQVTPALEKRFRRQALAETRDEMGLKENAGGRLDFADLRRVLKGVYTGQNERDIWRRFYEEAPYVENKKALFRQIASEEQRRELSYPQFDNLADLEAAGLEAGDKFYYRGRLAVKV